MERCGREKMIIEWYPDFCFQCKEHQLVLLIITCEKYWKAPFVKWTLAYIASVVALVLAY